LVRQFHLDVAVAAGKSGGGSDPIIAYPEPDAVESVGESDTLWAAAGTATESKTRTTKKPHARERGMPPLPDGIEDHRPPRDVQTSARNFPFL
jgi:hypothetical protein